MAKKPEARFVVDKKNQPEAFAIRILKRKMKPVGEFIRTAAALNAPYDSGDLRRSLNWRVITDRKKVTVRVGTNLIYAPVVELGWDEDSPPGKRAPDPYLKPALERNKAAIMYIFKVY